MTFGKWLVLFPRTTLDRMASDAMLMTGRDALFEVLPLSPPLSLFLPRYVSLSLSLSLSMSVCLALCVSIPLSLSVSG